MCPSSNDKEKVEHLLAEHREIKRLPYCLDKAIESGSIDQIPGKFVLGRGHVLFFLDKQWFVHSRYLSIHMELKRRGFNVTDFSSNWDKWAWTEYWDYYTPTEEEYELLKQRIIDRINRSKKEVWHYYGKPITKEEAIVLLTEK